MLAWRSWTTGWTMKIARKYSSPRFQLHRGCHQVSNLLPRHPAGTGFDLRRYLWNHHAWKHLRHAGFALDVRASSSAGTKMDGFARCAPAETSTTAAHPADGWRQQERGCMFRVQTLSPMVSTLRPGHLGDLRPWMACLRLRRRLVKPGVPLEASLGKSGPRDTAVRQQSRSGRRRTRPWTQTIWSHYDDFLDDNDARRQRLRRRAAANDLELNLQDKIGALRKYSPEDSLEVTTLNKIEMLTAVAPGGESS